MSFGAATLGDATAEHHRDAVGHGERLVLVVRDQDEGDADRLLEPARQQLDLHLLAQLFVECRERLVEKQHLGTHDERAGERDALALAAGEFGSLAMPEAGERDLFQRLVDAPLLLGGAEPEAPQAIGDVLRDVQMREDRIALEDHVGRAGGWPECPPSPGRRSRPSLRGFVEAPDHPQKRGLPAAGRAEKREELAFADRDGDRIERHESFQSGA